MAQSRELPLLVSYFEPFGGADLNASGLVTELMGRPDAPRLELISLPVSFEKAWPTLAAKLFAGTAYSAIIALGEAGGRKKISLERIGINWQESAAPDNDGAQPLGEKILPTGPDGCFSSLPIGELHRDLLGKTPLEIEISNSAGTFVCNHLMYQLVHWAHRSRVPAGFIHVPALRPSDGDYSITKGALLTTLASLFSQITHLVNNSSAQNPRGR